MNEQSKNIKTTMSFAEFREFNRDLKKLKRQLSKETDSKVVELIQKQIDLITKTLKLS
tara:strand:- start:2003 stop:2176 length:174 start_codon:yes stop_codon:yes gene_type:complete